MLFGMSSISRKTTFITSLGAGLEYYDFIIYGMMAEYLSILFFNEDHLLINLIKTFAIFAVGYLVRPLGGLFFGSRGDTFGRRKTLLNVMLLMALSTFAIGLLPTYSQSGILAPCLLLLMRLLQGLSFGAELPGALTVICEHSERKKHGTHTGFLISSVGIGSTLASLMLFILSKYLAREEILSWGWRVPFLLGGTLAIANYFIRKHLQETPDFILLQRNRPQPTPKMPLTSLFKNYRKEVLLGIGLTFFVASLVIFALFLPTYLSFFHYETKDVFLAMTWGTLWSALILPFCGRVADRFGKTTCIIGACLVGTVLFQVLGINGLIGLLLFTTLYQTIISFLMVSVLPILASLFPTHVRYTGIAACYNITYSLMGCAPLIITLLLEVTHTPSIGIWFLLATSAITLISVSFFTKLKVLSTL